MKYVYYQVTILKEKTRLITYAYFKGKIKNPEGKFDKIKSVIQSYGEIDITCLVETWMNPEDSIFNKINKVNDLHNMIGRRKGGKLLEYIKIKIKR